MIPYDVSFTYEHVIGLYCYIWLLLLMMLGYMKLGITYDLFPWLLDYVGLWDFTWSLHFYVLDGIVGKGLISFDDMNSWTCIIVVTLC